MQWILVLVACLWAASGSIVESRQIRINRYAVSVQDDDVQQARVKELKPTPYPAAGYRPEGRAFWLPGEGNVEGSGSESGSSLSSDLGTTTTELPIISTTESLDLSTTTAWETTDATTTTAPIEFRSGRAFPKAPYPAAGYRPSRAFLLPTELNQQQQQQQQVVEEAKNATAATPDSNDSHPVCGVSTNPLMPTPEPGSKDEPDSESVVITANLGPAVLVATAPKSSGIPVAIPLRSQPLIQAPSRGFFYTTHVEW